MKKVYNSLILNKSAVPGGAKNWIEPMTEKDYTRPNAIAAEKELA